MNRALAACAATLILTIACCGAAAAATRVNVRIEGRAETLFEGPIATEPHGVRATSDEIPAGKLRRCDGINALDPENTGPAVTPTAAGADAMALAGQTFDGRWYRDFEDYFLTRWGPDAQEPNAPDGGAYWGVLVNDTFTDVGGCQYQLGIDDEVTWVFDAFRQRPLLALFPESLHYGSGPRPLVVRGVGAGQPIPLEVDYYADTPESNPPAEPSRAGARPYAGARVSLVVTDPLSGFERVEETALGAPSDSDGRTAVSFDDPGWHRIKATVGTPGAEGVIRSNHLDVCVDGGGGAALEGATECDELPAADQPRVPPPTVGEIVGPETEEATPTRPAGGSPNPGSSAATGSLRLRRPRLDRRRLARGRLGVSWAILEAGPGVKRWTISSRTLGRRRARWVTRASGAAQTRATVRLPRGHAYRLRFAITDGAGRTSSISLGKVRVPKARHHHRGRHER